MNKYLTIILSVYLLNSQSLYSQDVYKFYDDALYLFLTNYKEHKSLVDSIITLEIARKSEDSRLYLLQAKIHLINDQKVSGIFNILQAIKLGVNIDHDIFSSGIIKKNLTEKERDDIMTIAPIIQSVPFKTANPIELNDLFTLLNFDQALRYFTYKFKDSLCISENKSLQFELEITRKLLKDHLDKYGIPDEKDFGREILRRFDIVISHHRSVIDSCQWLIPYYNLAYSQGKISKERYFEFFDWLNYRINKSLKFGQNPEGLKTNNKYYFFTIDDIKNIDNKRKSVGLCPLHVYAKNNNLELPLDYSYNFQEYLIELRKRLNFYNISNKLK